MLRPNSIRAFVVVIVFALVYLKFINCQDASADASGQLPDYGQAEELHDHEDTTTTTTTRRPTTRKIITSIPSTKATEIPTTSKVPITTFPSTTTIQSTETISSTMSNPST